MDQHKTIKGIIFDLDGTLFQLDIDWPALKKRISDEMGGKEINYDELLQTATPGEANKIIDIIDKTELEGALSGYVLPGVVEVLSEISKHYKLAVVTRNGKAAAAKALEKITSGYEVIIVARDDVQNLKPHPEAMELALKKLGLAPNEIVVVGDTIHDVEAAKAVGATSIAVHNPAIQFEPPGAGHYIKNMTELPGLLANIKEEGKGN